MPTSASASRAARRHSSSTSVRLLSYTSSIRCGWIRPSRMSLSRVSRPTSRRTGSKHDSSTASGVSSMMTLTPVTDSKARMLRPSRPMMRPFISSLGRCSTLTTVSAVCSLATRCTASTTIARARSVPSARASFSMDRTSIAASRRAPTSTAASSSALASSAVSPAIRSRSRSCSTARCSNSATRRSSSASRSSCSRPRTRKLLDRSVELGALVANPGRLSFQRHLRVREPLGLGDKIAFGLTYLFGQPSRFALCRRAGRRRAAWLPRPWH